MVKALGSDAIAPIQQCAQGMPGAKDIRPLLSAKLPCMQRTPTSDRPLSPTDARPHRIAIVAFAPAQLLDVTGPLEVFAGANGAAQRAGRVPPYEIAVVAPMAGALATTSGIPIVATRLPGPRNATPDTLLLSGGPGARAAVSDRALMRRLRDLCERSPRVGSICTGAFPLAATGLLDGRRATTHWAHFDEFATAFPRVAIDRDALFVGDGKFHTSAGISAGIDSALAMVERDLGRGVALEVAQALVVYLKRPGGQSQFSAQLAAQASAHDQDGFAVLMRWMSAHLHKDLSVDVLAERMAMSPRNFARRFAEAVRMPPARYVQSLRIDVARRLLTDGHQSITRIADRCGFASTESMRTAFQRQLGVAPSEFRERFRSAHAAR
jgi:transcriptional regulator GlxA family with amidase domain